MTNVAILQTTADLSASQTAQGIAQLVPTGTVFAYAGTSAPSGWLTCDGTAISRATYADLFSALGVAHGYGDNSTTFNLPDYRGRFVRGADAMFGGTAAARDPDRTARTAANTGGNSGNTVGSVQTNATAKNGMSVTNNAVTSAGQSTTHIHTTFRLGINNGGYIQTGAAGAGQVGGIDTGTTATNNVDHNHSVTSNVVLNAGDNETRPLNAYVNYIIKI